MSGPRAWPMRVTHVITRLIVGGAQENTIANVLGLQNRPGWTVDLITGPTTGPEGTLEPLFEKYPGVLSRLPSLVRPVQPLLDWKALRQLTGIFKRTHPTIVHTHSGKAGILGRWAAHKAGVPVILHSIHGPSFGPWQGALGNFIYKNAERFADKFTHHFIVVANAMAQQYLAAGIGSPEKYTRIFSGFDLGPFLNARDDQAARQQLGIAQDEIVVGKIARMIPLKGHDYLFDAAPEIIRRNPKIKFLLVGGGPWEERFQQRAREMGLERHFVFTGLLPPARIPAVVAVMDLLVHLSLREGLPRALPQALAGGKPVIAFDCDGAGEVCVSGRTGVLLKPKDQSGLIEAITHLAGNPLLRRELGENGRSFVHENFSVDKMVDDIFQLYLELLRRAGIEAPAPVQS